MADMIGTINVRRLELLHYLNFDLEVGETVIPVRLVFSEVPCKTPENSVREMLNEHFNPYFGDWLETLKLRGRVTQTDISNFRANTGEFFSATPELYEWQFADLQLDSKAMSPELVADYLNRLQPIPELA